MASKPERRLDNVEVTYNKKRWKVLEQLREKARRLMTILDLCQIHTITHGSIARGDVNEDSDVDIFISDPPSSFRIETSLEQANITVTGRTVIQATPVYTPKGYIEIDSATMISFPLMAMRRVEREFYQFGGQVDLKQLNAGVRVAGVNKRLLLIEPSEKGHFESSIIGREEATAKTLGVNVDTVLDRVRALVKRDAVGRTGVFIKRDLASDETFELVLKRLADENPAVRRKLRI